jgi:hypothetical protein
MTINCSCSEIVSSEKNVLNTSNASLEEEIRFEIEEFGF